VNKRIILVGPTCSGKTYIKDKFREKGYKCDVSYTSREKREGEIEGVDYHFISKKSFEEAITTNEFYEYVEYEGNYYGTGIEEWETCDIFIMETDGIKKIKEEDLDDCLIMYVNTDNNIRLKRMNDRGWNYEKILTRLDQDRIKFKDFKSYDVEISSGTL
jgi:guanylate kinase